MADFTSYFTVLVCGDETRNSKPHPEIFLAAAEKLETPPEKCVVFEDSPVGIIAAAAAGMKSIMVPDMVQPDYKVRQLPLSVCSSLVEAKERLAEFRQ